MLIHYAASGMFPSGRVFITPGAADTLDAMDIASSFDRHLRGDWGDLSEQDKAANDAALKDGGRLFSAYKDRNGTKLWIITEADRSMTTILLPSEY